MYPFDDAAWDEERWEAFLRANDRRMDRFMELLFRFLRKYPRPDPVDAEAYGAWKQALRVYFEDQGWRREEAILPLLWFDEPPDAESIEDPFLLDADVEDLDDLDHLPIYQEAARLSTDVLDWAHGLAGDVKDSTLVHYCSHITQIPSNIAKGHGIGREREALGGNIACAKRGLSDANAALDLLRQMRRAAYMDEATYRHLYEQTYEVRNALGVYVQDLRGRFNLGID